MKLGKESYGDDGVKDKIHTKRNNEFFRQLFFIVVVVALGLLIFTKLYFFLSSILGAITIYMILRPVVFWLTEHKGIKRWMAALGLVLGLMVLFGVGGYYGIKMLAREIPRLDTSSIVLGFTKFAQLANDTAGFKVVPDNLISQSGGYINKILGSLLDTTYSVAANMVLMFVTLFFMIISGRKMERSIHEYVPFTGHSLLLLRREVKNIVYSNAVGIPIVMIAQGVAALLIYWLLGVNNIFFWALITAICGLVPLIGTGITYIPLSLYFLADGNTFGGVMLLLYGMVVIGNVDSLVRMYLMKKVGDTHPLVVIFGALLGIPLFGFWGIIFGPLMISGFLLLVKIYYVEYGLLPSSEGSPKEGKAEREYEPQKYCLSNPAVKVVGAIREKRGKKR